MSNFILETGSVLEMPNSFTDNNHSTIDYLEKPSGSDNSVMGYQLRERPRDVVTYKQLGSFNMFEVNQAAGSYPDVAAHSFNLQLLLQGKNSHHIEFGGHQIAGKSASNQLFLAPHQTDCQYTSDSRHHLLSLELPTAWVQSVAQHTCRRQFQNDFGSLHASSFRMAAIAKRMTRLWRAANGDPRTCLVDLTAEPLLIIADLLNSSQTENTIALKPNKLASHVLLRVFDFIDSSLTGDVALPVLANVAGLSPYHFLRAFKADVGITPHQFVMQQRVCRAVHLLHRTKLSMSRVATDCGFSSQQHMSSVFGALRGSAPKTIRF